MARKDANPGQVEAAAERKERCFFYRKTGASFRSIARQIQTEYSDGNGNLRWPNFSHVQAYRDVTEVLKGIRKNTELAAEELVTLEAERLDVALLAIAKQVQAGHLGAIDRWVKLAERRAKLYGLDKPTKIEASGPGGGPIEIREVVVNKSTHSAESEE